MSIDLQERRRPSDSDLPVRRVFQPTDLQLRKLVKVFASFDTDADGVIDVLDFTGMAQVYCEAYGIAPRSQSWRKIHQCAQVMWRAVEQRTGSLNPAKLTRQEWISWMGSHEYDDYVTQAAIPFSLMAFWLADADHDGRCDVDEMMAAQRRSGMSEDEIRRSFDLLDTDGDGYVTTEDFAQALEEFYFSDDPDAPGNSIAGDL
ncbi:MAG TPA: EF-hand domain-containing protein [Jatrophihabitans sp.]|jgi:Ca2+-binding EF-hand superfamily protein|nr:EF-hand domain-containing protein [Jatrophihabitans sp.]